MQEKRVACTQKRCFVGDLSTCHDREPDGFAGSPNPPHVSKISGMAFVVIEGL